MHMISTGNMVGVDSVEYVLGPIPSGDTYYLRFIGSSCVDTNIVTGSIDCDLCSTSTIDPEFTYPNDTVCTFNNILEPLHSSGLDGRYTYMVLSGGPQLDLDPESGIIVTNSSDPGQYEVTNTLQGCGRMLISGVVDGPISGGLPKVVEFYVLADIDNLAQYGFGSANNGGGSDGIEFSFPAISVTAGTYIYVAAETGVTQSFLDVEADYTSNATQINGNDALELFCGGIVIDVYGDPNVLGDNEPWDYTDGWAYRKDNGSPNYGLFNASNWSFSGIGGLAGETSNSTATNPFPTGTFSSLGFSQVCADSAFSDTVVLQSFPIGLNSCQDHIYLSLDSDCVVEVTSDMLLLGEHHLCFGSFPVEIYDHYGRNIGPLITESYRGKTLTYQVSDGMNSCWGNLTIEDKLAPQVICRDTAISCIEGYVDNMLYADNCGIQSEVQVIHNRWIDLGCGDTLGYYSRRIVLSDIWGNSANCDQKIFITREGFEDLISPEWIEIDCCDPRLNSVLTNSFDENGRAHPIPYFISGINIGIVDPPFINGFPISELGEKCNIYTTFTDLVLAHCGASYTIRREWRIFDWCTGIDTSCIQYISILDTLGPELESMQPLEVAVNPHECKASVQLNPPWIDKECSPEEDVKIFYRIDYLDERKNIITLTGEVSDNNTVIYLPKGNFEVEYRVVDDCWNESYLYQDIRVQDQIPLTPVCDELTQVTLDPEDCMVRIFAEDLDDGSHD